MSVALGLGVRGLGFRVLSSESCGPMGFKV